MSLPEWALIVTVGLLAALIPAIPLKLVSNESIFRARDYWLIGLLTVAVLWCWQYARPFAPIAVFLLYWWPREDDPVPRARPAAATWAALVAFWVLVQQLPSAVWTYLPWAWLAIAAYADVVLARQWWRMKPKDRPWWHPYRELHEAAWFGQRTVAACLFALILPFAPWWALPVPLAGLWFTSSWVALIASLGALFVLYPISALAWPTIIALYVFQETTRWNFTPRGASLDSLRQRWNVLILTLRAMRPGHRIIFTVGPRRISLGWWPWGYGPRTSERAIIKWASAYGIETIPLGHMHIDIAQFLFEYGLPGVAAIGLLVWQVFPRLHWGDPWSAAWIAGIVLGCGTIPFRVVTVGLIWFIITAHLGRI